MAKLTELVRDHTQLDREQVAHLSRLVSEWGMLADFCFSDLLLYVPTSSGRWAVVAQVRPATGQTMYQTRLGLVHRLASRWTHLGDHRPPA